MDEKKLVIVRKLAEAAVHDMPEGEIKTKAFEVILGRLLSDASFIRDDQVEHRQSAKELRKASKGAAKRPTAAERILALRDDGFFSKQRTLTEIVKELGTRGWHYKQTDLSGVMLKLTQDKKLRRIPVKDANKVVYNYSNW